MNRRVVLFLVTAWCLPAAIAGALGWSGIWGTGSAFWDFLNPFPTAGGFLHLPSVVACAALIASRQAGTEPLATLARPLLVGLALAGAMLSIDVGELATAATTDAEPRHLFSASPVGLFLLCDGIAAQLALPHHEPLRRGAAWRVAGLFAALVPACIAAASGYRLAPSSRHALLPGSSHQGPARGDEIVAVYSAIGFDPAQLEAQIRAEPMLALHPEQHETAEAQAIHFFDSLSAAREMQLEAARLTWCRYEDGTPERWIDGQGDCFSDHVGFGERWEALVASGERELSPDVRGYVALSRACEGVVLAPDAPAFAVAAQRRCADLPRLREGLLARGAASEADLRALRMP